jgi:hypothetical protein
LSCWCGDDPAARALGGDHDCTRSISDVQAEMCGPAGRRPVLRQTGCGKIALKSIAGLDAEFVVFDAQSGKQIGHLVRNDVSDFVCTAFTFVYGEDLGLGSLPGDNCAEAETCGACGVAVGSVPPCR